MESPVVSMLAPQTRVWKQNPDLDVESAAMSNQRQNASEPGGFPLTLQFVTQVTEDSAQC